MVVQELYIFNPENDLAIANGGMHYMAPPKARSIAYDLSMLPMWYAGANDYVLCPDADYKNNAQCLIRQFGLFPGLLLPEEIKLYENISSIVPWGWSPEIVCRLNRWGIDSCHLPTHDSLSQLKRLSHRAITITILSSLINYGYSDIPYQLPLELRTANEVRVFIENAPKTVLKAPWSGSGKGLSWGRGVYDTTLERWSTGILKRQGMVIGEPFYEKVRDFAMEFFSDGAGTVSFAGYSLFTTDAKGVYKSNLLASDETILAEILQFGIKKYQIERLQKAYIDLLSSLIGMFYRGYLGIDMMIYNRNGIYHLHPCVEMNLRMNMGMVARIFYDRYVNNWTIGNYYVDYYPDSAQLWEDHRMRQSKSPLIVSEGKIEKGYFSLAPITSHTHYRARIEIGEE